MSSRRPSSIVANPILIGAITVLVVVVAVFLAYNANNGLPFVPSHDLEVTLPNGQNLVPANDVREGGKRIGFIAAMHPVRLPGGRVGARVSIKLDGQLPPIPVDSRWAVRPRSALSLKYLELKRGTSRHTIGQDGVVPISQAHNPVELDELLDAYDARTRRGAQESLRGASDAFASRGADLNETISLLPSFFGHLEPVARTLAAPDTNLRGFFRELGDAARVIAPIGTQYARGFTNGATTFDAIARDPRALLQSIVLTPPTLAAGERSLKVQRPFLRDVAALSSDLRIAAREVTPALPPINRALRLGVPVQEQSVALSRRTQDVLLALSDLTGNPATATALRALTATVATVQPQLRYLGPKITVCNGWNFFWTFNADHVSERDPTGTAERVLSISGDPQDNSVTSLGAVVPANGEHVAPGGTPQFLHAQPYARSVDAHGAADCEDGQRGYMAGPLAPTPPANGGAERFKHLVSAPRTPGDQGPVYRQIVKGEGVGRGPSRVPAGETFSAEPETGPTLP